MISNPDLLHSCPDHCKEKRVQDIGLPSGCNGRRVSLGENMYEMQRGFGELANKKNPGLTIIVVIL